MIGNNPRWMEEIEAGGSSEDEEHDRVHVPKVLPVPTGSRHAGRIMSASVLNSIDARSGNLASNAIWRYLSCVF